MVQLFLTLVVASDRTSASLCVLSQPSYLHNTVLTNICNRVKAADGVPTANIYGVDVDPAFFDIGYELFRDKTSLRATFLQADIFDTGSPLAELSGSIDITWTSSVLHLWTWDKQLVALCAILRLLDASPDPLLAGRFLGFSEPGVYAFESKGRQEEVWRHDGASFERLFREACASLKLAGWEVELETPAWVENMSLEMDKEQKHPWDLQINFVARRRKSAV